MIKLDANEIDKNRIVRNYWRLTLAEHVRANIIDKAGKFILVDSLWVCECLLKMRCNVRASVPTSDDLIGISHTYRKDKDIQVHLYIEPHGSCARGVQTTPDKLL